MMPCSRFLLVVLIVSGYLSAHGLDPEEWKKLHQKMFRKAAEDKASKLSAATMNPVLGVAPSSLIGEIPIRLEYENEIIDTDFKLFDSPDPSTQAKTFCTQYDLSEAYCEALTERAVDVFAAAVAASTSVKPARATSTLTSAPAVPDFTAATPSASPSPTPASESPPAQPHGELLTSIPIDLNDGSSIRNVEFKLYAGSDPVSQALDFCKSIGLMANSCEALSNRAESVFSQYVESKKQTKSSPAEQPSDLLRKSSVAAKLADIVNKKRQAKAVVADATASTSTLPTGELLDSISIQMQDGSDTYTVDFKLYAGSDALTQSRAFCAQYKLNDENCQAVSSRAEAVYADAVKKQRAPAPATTITAPTPTSRRLIENIPVRLEFQSKIVDTDFKLFDSPDPSTQAKTFCTQYDLSEAYCEALTERAVDVFAAAVAAPPSVKPDYAPPSSSQTDKVSAAAKLAELLSKRRKPSSADANPSVPAAPPVGLASSVPPPSGGAASSVSSSGSAAATAGGKILDIIPIRMEYKDEIVDVEFKVYDNADPTSQAHVFCREHDLMAEYCEALTARAEFLFSNR